MQAELHKLVVQNHKELEAKLGGPSVAPVSDSGDGPSPQVDGAIVPVAAAAGGNQVASRPSKPPASLYKKSTDLQKSEQSHKNLKDYAFDKPETKKEVIAWFKYWLAHDWCDIVMSIVVILNVMIFFVEIQLRADDLEYQLGLSAVDPQWARKEQGFHLAEIFFNVVYLMEIAAQAFFLPRRFFRCHFLQVLDVGSVIVTSFVVFILVPLNLTNGVAGTILRFIKLIRVLRLQRLIKVLKTVESLYSLRVLVTAITMSVGSLFWAVIVLLFIILTAAMIMSEFCYPYLEPSYTKITADEKKWLYDYFGSFLRAAYTMFEATFTGIWASRLSRPMIEVSTSFRLFWIVYTLCVNFAVIRVIGALFLKQTMDVASIDKDKMAAAKLKERRKVCDTLEAIFKKGDESGDGFISRDEFDNMMQNDEILQAFTDLELEPLEVYMLFNMLCEDEGATDQHEFLNGALKLKMTVKSIDMIQILHEQNYIKKCIHSLQDGIQQVDKGIHPKNHWRPTSSYKG